jgi:hypothetical protein
MIENREFIASCYVEQHPSFKMNMYKFLSRKAKEYALEIDRELAEGPTVLVRENYHSPVELWPLVWEGSSDALPG